MASVKLTNVMRDQIIRDVMGYRFNTEFNGLLALQAELNKKIYEDVFTKELRELLTQMPDSWKSKDGNFNVSIGGTVYRINVGEVVLLQEANRRFRRGPEKRDDTVKPIKLYFDLPAVVVYSSNVFKVYSARDEIGIAFNKHTQLVEKYAEEVNQAKHELHSVVHGTTTTKQLIEAWPEIEPFVNKVMGVTAVTSTGVIIRRDELNDRFHLPVKE